MKIGNAGWVELRTNEVFLAHAGAARVRLVVAEWQTGKSDWDKSDYGSVVTGIKVTGPLSPDGVSGQAEALKGL